MNNTPQRKCEKPARCRRSQRGGQGRELDELFLRETFSELFRYAQSLEHPGQPTQVHQTRRCTLWIAAWSVHLISISSTQTWGGRLATHTNVSAISSAVSGSTPA